MKICYKIIQEIQKGDEVYPRNMEVKVKMKHIMIEAECIYNLEKNKDDNIPKFCKFGIGNINVNCLMNEETINSICPYLIFGKASSTLALTDRNGEVINATTFWDDLKLSEEEWIMKEEEWIKKVIIY